MIWVLNSYVEQTANAFFYSGRRLYQNNEHDFSFKVLIKLQIISLHVNVYACMLLKIILQI